MMNIGIVTTWFERGAAYVSKQYLSSLAADNNLFIFARGGEDIDVSSPEWSGDHVTVAKHTLKNSTYIDFFELKAWIEQNAIELIIFNEQTDWEIIVQVRQLDVKIAAYIDYYTQETAPFFALYDTLLCNTQRHYSAFSWHRDAHYIPWGTDTGIFNTQQLETSAKAKFFHSAGMGGIRNRKGTDLLVNAFSQTTGDCELIIHSQVPVNAYGDSAALIESDPRIRFIHKTVTAPGLYHLGNVYVYPSRLEGIGLTICEALACGLPVITTDCPPMSEFVTPGETGELTRIHQYLARPDGYYWPESIVDTADLAQQLQSYIDHPEKIAKQSANARNSSLEHFDWRKNSESLSTLLNQVVADPNKSQVLKRLSATVLGYAYMRRGHYTPIMQRLIRKLRNYRISRAL